MTFEQIKFAIEQIRKFNNQKNNTCYEAMDSLLDKVRYYFTDIDFNKFFIYTYKKEKTSLTKEDFVADCNAMIFTLEGMLAKDKNYPMVKIILNDLDKYSRCKSEKAIKEAIRSIYHTYSDKIKFDKVVEKLIYNDATNDPSIYLGADGFDKTLLNSMLKKLENYANDVCFGTIKKENQKTTNNKSPQINITNNNILSSNTNIDVVVNNAIEKLENECLSTEQENLVKEKIKEIEEIIKFKNSKKEKWKKFGEILKWVAEQGLQVASIIVPLLSSAVQG